MYCFTGTGSGTTSWSQIRAGLSRTYLSGELGSWLFFQIFLVVLGLFLCSEVEAFQGKRQREPNRQRPYHINPVFSSLSPLGQKTSHELKHKVHLTTSTCSSPAESFLIIGWTFTQTGSLSSPVACLSHPSFIFNIHWCLGSLFPKVSIKRNKIVLVFLTQTCPKALLSKCRCVWHMHSKLKPATWLHKCTGYLPLNSSGIDCSITLSFWT